MTEVPDRLYFRVSESSDSARGVSETLVTVTAVLNYR